MVAVASCNSSTSSQYVKQLLLVAKKHKHTAGCTHSLVDSLSTTLMNKGNSNNAKVVVTTAILALTLPTSIGTYWYVAVILNKPL